MTESGQDPYLAAIWKALSGERLEYGYCGGGSQLDAVANYLWNIALCEAPYPSLQALEVALRNTLYDAGAVIYGAAPTGEIACWLDADPPVLVREDQRMITEAKRRLRDKGKPLDPGHLIAELTFGFWTALLDVRYENSRILWPRLFGQGVFKHAPRRLRSRKGLSPILNQVRHLRHRAFHHEPIWHWRDLRAHHTIILDLIGWMSPELQITIAGMDRFEQVHAAGVPPFRDQVSEHLADAPPSTPDAPDELCQVVAVKSGQPLRSRS